MSMSEQRPDLRRTKENGSNDKRSRRNVLKAASAAGVAMLAGCLDDGSNGAGNGTGGGTANGGSNGDGGGNSKGGANGKDSGNGKSPGNGNGEQMQVADRMTVFHAGSLTPPFEAAEPKFEDKYSCQVLQESAGSVASTKKITAQGQKASVLGVSDFRLLRDVLLPEFGNWYSIFTTNAMTVAYTEKSKGAQEIGTDNWWEILSRDDVTVAHSDPSLDPNGYRSVMSMKLGSLPFHGEKLYDDATLQALRENAKISAAAEITLMSQLQAGALDYAWTYSSAGASHPVKTVDLQPQVDLSKLTAEYARFYSQVKVDTESGTYTGAPIAYGITVPSVAKSPKLGARWVKYFITEPGQQILEDSGFTPVEPAVVPKAGQEFVPEPVAKNAKAKGKIGPLTLSAGSSKSSLLAPVRPKR